MIKTLFQSLKKSRRLRKISKNLAAPLKTQDMFKMATQGSKKDYYLDELIDITESDQFVKMVMTEYNADRQTLKELYNKLILIGAGQFTKGHYVAASSLVYPLTLKFLLKHYDGQDFSINEWDDKNSAMYIANRLIEYFEKGEVGEVE
jgi:hypothetical protein